MLQPIFFYALKAWSKTRMLHEARTVHIRPLRARATMRSRQPPTSPPFRSHTGSGRGAGEGEGAPAVRRSTGTEDVAHPSHRERATHPLPANGSYPQRSGTYRLECHWRIASTSRFLIILAVRAAVCSFLFRQRSPYATLRSSYIASVS